MIPNKFNIVDFGGFDLVAQSGEAVPGIYDRIVDSHWNCVYIMCFGLKFAGFDIAPQYMAPEITEDIIELGGYISIDRDDVITVHLAPLPPAIIPGTFEANGTFTPPSGVDGFAPVTVNVETQVDLYPLWTDIYDNPMPTGVTVTTPTITAPLLQPPWVASASQNVQNFVNNVCRLSTRASAAGSSATVNITKAIAQMSLNQLIHDGSIFSGLVEYYGYLYNTQLLNTYSMVLLGDFSQGGSATGNALADAITNYSAVALQGIYSKNRTSGFNTTIIYPLDLNVERWTGMKDRNNSYSCNVIFTDANTVSLSGNRQVIIYGIP